jgi:hypothetical protein
MNFSTEWISWITMCVESVNYNIIRNDRLVGPITPAKDFRHWNPLSPYLFILCARRMSELPGHVELRGNIQQPPWCKNL